MGKDKEYDSVRDIKAVTHGTKQKDGLGRQQPEEVISRDNKDEDDAQQHELYGGIQTDFKKDRGAKKEQRNRRQTALLQYLPQALRTSRINYSNQHADSKAKTKN